MRPNLQTNTYLAIFAKEICKGKFYLLCGLFTVLVITSGIIGTLFSCDLHANISAGQLVVQLVCNRSI